MLRNTISLFILSFFMCQGVQAGDVPTEVTDQCVLSIRNVYRFYYREVHPNPDPACHTNVKMADKTAEEMQMIIGELKNNCSPTTIAQVTQSLQLDTDVG